MNFRLFALAAAMFAAVAFMWPQSAHATIGPCCGGNSAAYGPNVQVSDGTIIQSSTVVGDTAQHIAGIVYTVHIPAGTTVVNYSFPGNFSVNQSLNVVTDQAADQYVVETRVDDTSNVSVTTTTTATNGESGLNDTVMAGAAANSVVVTAASGDSGD